MGTFYAEVIIANPEDPQRRDVRKLPVDTGSTYTWISREALNTLRVQPTTSRKVLTIEGRLIERQAGEVLMTLELQTLHTLCLFAEPGELEVLGAVTLEQFGLAVDPIQHRLVPNIMFGA